MQSGKMSKKTLRNRRPVGAKSGRAMGTLGLLSLGVSAAFGCNSKAETSPLTSAPPDGLKWEEGGPSFLAEAQEVEAYTGSDPSVIEAQERLPTGSSLHSEVILRSCGPLGGVCHNKKEYPDLRTPANFLSVIGAPCNVQSGTTEGVFDRCERTGDRLRWNDWGNGKDYEIGWIEIIPGTPSEDNIGPEMPGLHIHLGDPVAEDDFPKYYTTGRFSRLFVVDGAVEQIGYATWSSPWYRFDDGRHIVAEVAEYQVDDASRLMAVGIEQGDLNRNGIYGARPDAEGNVRGPVSLVEPGDPETSYLVARLRGHMQGEPVPGTRMPLANPPFSVAEMISLFCFVEGIPESGQLNLASEIDYKNCSYADPATHEALAVEGAGQGWADRVSPLLEANCGGCHSEERAEGDLILVGEGVYDFLLETESPTDPEGRPLIVPGDPLGSYLYLKLIDDPSIEGKGMPVDPLAGTRKLSPEELADIEAWILGGAAP